MFSLHTWLCFITAFRTFPFVHTSNVKMSIFVVVFIFHAKNILLNLTYNVAFPYIFRVPLSRHIDNYKLIFNVLFIDLWFHIFIIDVFVWQPDSFSVLDSVLLKIDHSILHDIQVVHFLIIDLFAFFLSLDVICSREETVSYPVLKRIHYERNYEHHKQEQNLWMTVKYG